MTERQMKRWTCPECRCRTTRTAAERCKPEKDYSGEYDCPGNYIETDDDGNFIVPAASKTTTTKGD